MGIDLIDTLARHSGANFPIALGEDVIGAFVTVATTGARDAIPTNVLRTGALVRIANTSSYYTWNGSAWVSFIFAGTGDIRSDGSVAMAADLPMGSHKLTGLQAGSATGHSVEYDQLNTAIAAAFASAISTLADWKQSVRAATTANITLSGAQTIDGVSVIAGNRVLVKNQTTGSQNGIYVAASGAWARSTDADADAEVTTGLTVAVEEGTVNGPAAFRNVFMLTTANPLVVGTTALTFTALGTVSADGTTITLASGVLSVATGGISNTQVNGAAAIAGTKISPDFGNQVVRTTGQFVGATSGTPTATADAGSFESCTTGSGSLRGICHRQASADANGARAVLQKSRGTHASPAAVAAEDAIGENVSRSHDGSAFFDAGSFGHVADAAGGTSKRTRAQAKLHNGTALVTNEDAVQHITTTIDATLTVVRSIALAADSVLRVTYGIVGAQSASSNRAIRTTTVTVRRSGSGDPVVVAYADACPLFKDDGTWGADTEIGHQINTTSDALEIIVKGKAATTITWTTDVQYGAR